MPLTSAVAGHQYTHITQNNRRFAILLFAKRKASRLQKFLPVYTEAVIIGRLYYSRRSQGRQRNIIARITEHAKR